MRIVPVDTPSGENSLSESILAWAANVVHDLVAPIFNDGIGFAVVVEPDAADGNAGIAVLRESA